MPRMSKRKRHELSFFLDEKNRIKYNEFCLKCQKTCKQSFRVFVVQCPLFLRKKDNDGRNRENLEKEKTK